MLRQWLSALSVLPPAAYEQLLEKIDEAVLVIDHKGRILEVNPAAERLLYRLSPSQPTTFVGSLLAQTLGPMPWLAVPPVPTRVRRPAPAPWSGAGLAPTRWPGSGLPPRSDSDLDSGGSWTVDAPQRAAPAHDRAPVADASAEHPLMDVCGSGIDLCVRVSALHDRDSRRIGWAVVARDVTDQNRRHAELEQANGRLGDQSHTIELLRADLAAQAIHDHLTGLYNRRHLMSELAAAVQYAAAARSQLSVAVLDIDQFKKINERFGMAVGDGVLVHLATMISGAILPGEVVARHDGQEFALVLPGVDAARAAAYVDALRQLIGSGELLVEGHLVRATFSAGVAGFTGGERPDDLLRAADAALCAAKRGGRNRVELAGRDSVELADLRLPQHTTA